MVNCMKKYSSSSFVFMLALACAISTQSKAQGNQSTPVPSSVVNKFATNQSTPNDMENEMTIMRDEYAGKYNVSNLENLSKLYWRLGAFDTGDERTIENFIKINDCKIYQTYWNNDIEWKKIVGSMRQYIEQAKATFPLNYQFTIEINLGKYDSEKGGFEIINGTGFSKTKLIHARSSNINRIPCKDKSMVETYPQSVLIKLKEPFDLNFIKIDEHVAQAFILNKKNDPKRSAFLRLRISFDQYDGNIKGINNELYAVMRGNIDGFEVFEDRDQKSLLYTQSDFVRDDEKMFGLFSPPPAPQTKIDANPTMAVMPVNSTESMSGFAATQ